MNSLFERNVQALEKRNKDLAIKLNSHIITDVPQLKKENDFYNLQYKNSFLHNINNPLAEAQEIFSRSENSPVTIHLVYGIGLGYLFQYSAKYSQGTVILLEEDLNILKIAFTLVDFTNDILKNNVYITNNIEECGAIIYKKSNTKNVPLLLSTINYRNLNEKRFNQIVEELTRMVGSFSLDLKYTQERFFPLISNIITNIPCLVNEIPLNRLKNKYKGKTAVIVSAGPTLDRNINTIKKYRDSMILIVVGTALRTIIKNGITPDFLCVIEAYDSSQQFKDLDLSQINFVTEPYSNSNLRKLKFRRVYTHISSNMPVNSFWQKISGENIDDYLSKGTVSYTALNTARILGCSRIILVGQDLAYVAGQCYSKDSAYKDLSCEFNKENNRWEITAPNFDEFAKALFNSKDVNLCRLVAQKRLKDLNNSLYFVKGITGDQIPTESVYAAFIKPLTEFTERFNDREYINTSLVGAQIDGFKNLSLEEAIKNEEKVSVENFNYSNKPDIEYLKKNILNEINGLKSILCELETGKKLVAHLNNDTKRYKSATLEVLKSLKKVSKLFVDISEANKNTVFDFITTLEKIDLDYIMKMTQNFDLNTINNLSAKLYDYFNNGENRAKKIISLLEKSLGDI